MVVEMDRSKDWLDQAEYDLRTAKQLSDLGSHAWSCFISQQAAEKALKSVLEKIGLPSWGHDLIDLVKATADKRSVPQEVGSACHRLNLYYVATRYPDAFSAGTPADKFSKAQSISAMDDARKVIEFARQVVH